MDGVLNQYQIHQVLLFKLHLNKWLFLPKDQLPVTLRFRLIGQHLLPLQMVVQQSYLTIFNGIKVQVEQHGIILLVLLLTHWL